MKTHPVHFHLDILSRSSQCGHRCRRPASVQQHQNTNPTLLMCVPVRWPGTPSRHPLPCKYKCCCRSWPRPGAEKHIISKIMTRWEVTQLHTADLPPWLDATQHAWHLVCASSQLWHIHIRLLHPLWNTNTACRYAKIEIDLFLWFHSAQTFNTNLPRPKLSCPGCMWPADSQKGPKPHIWLHFHVLPTLSNSGRQIKSLGKTYIR